MATPSPAYLGTIRAIDRVTQVLGIAVALLIVPLVLANTVEVFMRYFLRQPTAWAADPRANAGRAPCARWRPAATSW